jgi:type I restriction enzyme R subunit
MHLGNEKSSVQNPMVRYAIEAGWTYLPPDEALRQRPDGPAGPVLWHILTSQLQKLNPGVVDPQRAEEVARAICRSMPNIEGNLTPGSISRG